MPAQDVVIAEQFRSAAEEALRTGDFEPVIALLAPDVECVTPQHTLQGVDAVEAIREEFGRARPTKSFGVEFENGEWKRVGDGRYSCEIRALYLSSVSDAQSYSRDRSFELTIRAGAVSRYEMRFSN